MAEPGSSSLSHRPLILSSVSISLQEKPPKQTRSSLDRGGGGGSKLQLQGRCQQKPRPRHLLQQLLVLKALSTNDLGKQDSHWRETLQLFAISFAQSSSVTSGFSLGHTPAYPTEGILITCRTWAFSELVLCFGAADRLSDVPRFEKRRTLLSQFVSLPLPLRPNPTAAPPLEAALPFSCTRCQTNTFYSISACASALYIPTQFNFAPSTNLYHSVPPDIWKLCLYSIGPVWLCPVELARARWAEGRLDCYTARLYTSPTAIPTARKRGSLRPTSHWVPKLWASQLLSHNFLSSMYWRPPPSKSSNRLKWDPKMH